MLLRRTRRSSVLASNPLDTDAAGRVGEEGPATDVPQESGLLALEGEQGRVRFGALLAAMHALVLTPLQGLAERVAAGLGGQISAGGIGNVSSGGGSTGAGGEKGLSEGLVASFTGVSRVSEVLQRVIELCGQDQTSI